tara:strand:+ start:3798 stop:6530 length:2733 start_codon:yes stop_codon:yes gene_type:complete
MKQLQLESDYDHAPPEVALRFYELSDGRKRQLHVQDLYNLSRRLRDGKENGWASWTGRVLARIWPAINKPHLIRKNPSLLQVSADHFARWKAEWNDFSDAIVDRDTQASYSDSESSARLAVELHTRGTKTTLACVVIAPDGTRAPFHTVGEQLAGEHSEVTVAEKRYRLDVPFDRDVLNRVFGKNDPEVATTAIADHLPTILHHRLDLIAGPSVTTVTHRGTPRIEIKSEGEELIVAATIKTAPIFADPAITPARLAPGRDSFTIVQSESPVLEDVRQFLNKLPIEPSKDGVYRLPTTPETVEAIRQARTALPPDVILKIDYKIEDLFKDTVPIKPTLTVHEGSGWLDVEIGGLVGDEPIDAEDLHAVLHNGQTTVRTRSGVMFSFDANSTDDLRTFLDNTNLELGQHRITIDRAPTVAATVAQLCVMRMPRDTRAMLEAVRERPPLPDLQIPEDLVDVLRNYQTDGVRFLHNRTGHTLGCLLADDMGLGKTLQILTYLRCCKVTHPFACSLIVCPASVIAVWTGEIAKFAPDLRVRELTGPPERRHRTLAEAGDADAIIASYAVVRNDITHLRSREFHTIIIDEAQNIRNPDAEITLSVKSLQSERRIAASGTPLENRPLDLWSIVDFLNPDYLGDRDSFAVSDLSTLRHRIEPLMLRRTKEEVAPELPSRTEETICLPLNEFQDALYTRELGNARKRAASGNVMDIFAAITRLRQLCCHPALLPERAAESTDELPPIAESAKLAWLMETLPDLLATGHCILVFSQFTSMLEIIEKHLVAEGLAHFKLTGKTPVEKRGELVQEFTDAADPSVFLLSLKAAGTGLNLTRADYVVIFDPWWNPAAERQAIDRTHRIGQQKPVIAYRFACHGTIEEKVLALQAEKQELFSAVIDDADGTPDLDRDELLALLG